MLKKLENNNIGATSYVERTLMYLVIFFVTTFILDLILLAATMIITNHQLNYVAAKLQFQSGFIGSAVGNGDVTGHWSNRDIYEYLDAGMESVGIDGTKYTWKLTYDKDIYDSNGKKYDTVIFDSNGVKNYNYVTPGNNIDVNNLDDTSSGASNIYETSSLKLTFDYHYKFSGKLFYMLHVLTEMNLYSDFANKYVN